MKSGGGAGSGSAALSAASAPAARDAGVSTVEKRPSSGAKAGLRKRLRKVATEQPANASGSTARTSTDKDKGMMELEEVPERRYTMRELYEVEDQAGADRYFTSIMTRLKCVYGEDPLVPRWSTISGSSLFWTEGPLSSEYLRGALHPTLAKQVYECSSKELMNRAGKSVVWVPALQFGWGSGRPSSLGGRRPLANRGDSIPRRFESSLEKMGRVSYEFGYRVALERLRGKHLEIMIELDPFAECSEDTNVEMDLDQPFDDGTPFEKQLTL
ncbi:hypothetical protein B296_00036525 [Ensete ventricosum]|uniref:Uncharacterized protein n=1 Tax=Ensete ventricosum TaxID=4639 RepID=A0A426YDL6_ENSVE|nr:hypothetical protein B296_00036525 [Ensete ventricosum]